MSDFSFQKVIDRVDNNCSKALNLFSLRNEAEILNIKQDFEQSIESLKKESKLTIAFVGQYDSGKSTLIAAMTKAKFIKPCEEEIDGEIKYIDLYKIGNKHIKISSQVMTEVAESYEWEDVLIIDTPGLYAGKIEHDQQTLNMISKADLLVFVISNESFNQQGGDFFKKLTKEMKRDSQTILVVNKMGRETGDKKVLINTINRVLEPKLTDDYYTCFIDAKSYLDAFNEDDDEEKEYLIEDSNFDSFYDSIQKLINDNKITAKFLTPLHKIQDSLEKTKNLLTISNNKKQMDIFELARKRKHLLRSFKMTLKNKLLDELKNSLHKIKMMGEEITKLIDGEHTKEQIESKISEAEKHISEMLNDYESNSKKIIEEHKKEIISIFSENLEESLTFNSFCNEIVTELEHLNHTIDLKIDIPSLKASSFDKEKLNQIIGVIENTVIDLIEINQEQLKEKSELYQEIGGKLASLAKIGLTASILILAPVPPEIAVGASSYLINREKTIGKLTSSGQLPAKIIKSGGDFSKVATEGIKEFLKVEEKNLAEVLKNRNFWEKLTGSFGEGAKVVARIDILKKSIPIVNAAGALFTIGGTIVEEKKKIQFAKDLADTRNNIRENIKELAKTIESSYLDNIKNNVVNIYDEEISITEERENEFRNQEESIKGFLEQVNKLLKEVKADIDLIIKTS